MSINQFTEDSYEQTLIDLFKRMGYQYECGHDVERDFRDSLLPRLMSGEIKVGDVTL